MSDGASDKIICDKDSGTDKAIREGKKKTQDPARPIGIALCFTRAENILQIYALSFALFFSSDYSLL